ncbi:MAG: hypothetical protein HYR85_13120 [Planctomycetes bacterium]|nr:hypothetical protein [Planctomycetota bacterium]
MTRRLEETFEAILGSVRTKIENVEAEDAYLPPRDTEGLPLPEADAAAEIESPLSVTELGDESPQQPIRPENAGDPVEREIEHADLPGAFLIEHLGKERIVRHAKGAYLVPNYVSDYLLKNLSLGEQAVFNRLFRLSAGFYKKTEPITIRALGEACGLSPKFTATIVRSLAGKRLMKVILVNPLTKKVRLKLVLPAEVEKKIVLCGVCHELILEDEPWKNYPIARPVRGRAQAVVAHERCVEGEPFFES